MKPLVLIILAVVWGVALIPPLLRSRSDLRPNSSVVSFRRTLSDLSRIPGRPGSPPARGMGMGSHVSPVSPVRAFRGSAPQGRAPSAHPAHPQQVSRAGQPYPRSYGYSPGAARARANRATMIRRRQNVLFTLVTAVVVSAIAGFALGVVIARTAFFLSLIVLALYVWLLATLRRNEEMRSAQRYVYSDAA